MANYRAVANGNWSSGATWGGGDVPPNGEGHDIYSNGFTVTIDQDVDVALLTNRAITASFVGGGTSAAVGGSFTAASSGTYSLDVATITANATGGTVNNNGTAVLNINGCTVVGANGASYVNVRNNSSGNITFDNCVIVAVATLGGAFPVQNTSTATGTLTFNTCTLTGSRVGYAVGNLGAGNIIVSGGVLTGADFQTGQAIQSINTGNVTCSNCTINAGATGVGISNGNGQLTLINCVVTASNGANGVTSTGAAKISGTFISAPNGYQPINAARWILDTAPTNAYIQHALDGINANSFVRFYTADNALGQANPTDVRSGVSYASGNLTGTLTVPARGSVALSVNYGPSMPFTATRSGTTATATLAYSYPLVVGDEFTVTGASNSEWNGSYTIASVVSGTEITFTVPDTHSATAGTGALMQTTGTAVLDPAAVASAVWGAATRTITGGVVDTLTNAPASVTPSDIWSHSSRTITGGTVDTLTNAPTVPSAASIRAEIDSNSTQLAAIKAKTDLLPASPAATGDIPTADISSIKSTTDALNTDRLGQCSTVATTGAQLAAALS
jgi:hypothetical protein